MNNLKFLTIFRLAAHLRICKLLSQRSLYLSFFETTHKCKLLYAYNIYVYIHTCLHTNIHACTWGECGAHLTCCVEKHFSFHLKCHKTVGKSPYQDVFKHVCGHFNYWKVIVHSMKISACFFLLPIQAI